VIDAADGGIGAPDCAVEEGAPVAIGRLTDRSHHDMDMRLGIELAAGVMLEHGPDEIARPHRLAIAAALIGTHLGMGLFHPLHGLAHRLPMLLKQAGVTAHQSQHAGRFGHGEREVEAMQRPST
jgi:hypothetical protein